MDYSRKSVGCLCIRAWQHWKTDYAENPPPQKNDIFFSYIFFTLFENGIVKDIYSPNSRGGGVENFSFGSKFWIYLFVLHNWFAHIDRFDYLSLYIYLYEAYTCTFLCTFIVDKVIVSSKCIYKEKSCSLYNVSWSVPRLVQERQALPC